MSKNNSSEQNRLLSEILKWIRFTGIKEAKSTLTDMLDTDVKRFVYQKSDGTIGMVELAKLAGLGSKQPVSDMWNAWPRIGLGESISVRGGSRFKRSFDLEDFGIKIPEIKPKIALEEDKKQPVEQKPAVKEVNDSGKEVTGEQNSKNMTT